MDWLTQTWEITFRLSGLWLGLLIALALLALLGPPVVIDLAWTWRFRRARRTTADFRRLTEALPLGIALISPAGEIVLLNARARELWPSLAIGAPAPPELTRLAGPAEGMSSGIATSPAGLRVLARAYALPSRRGHDLLLALEDATRLQQESEFASALVRQVSHELKTPLSVIRGHASRFASDGQGDPEEVRRAWTVVDDEATRLTDLIDQALLMARLETSEPLFQWRALNLRALCEEVVIDLAERVAAAGAEFDFEVEDGSYPFRGDRPALRQMLINLIDNAVKYGGRGVRIVLSLRPSGDGRSYRLAVQDDGPGIVAADLSLIFEKGFRGGQSRGSRAGSGLGLALVRSIAERHRGSVSAESRPGAGTTIVISLPLDAEE